MKEQDVKGMCKCCEFYNDVKDDTRQRWCEMGYAQTPPTCPYFAKRSED